MSFKYSRISSGTTDIHLLEYADFNPLDYVGKLTENEVERLQSFGHERRKMEFVATRLLRHDLFGFEHIHYDAHGAPFIEKEGFISISHSKNMVGIAVNPNYQVGLDLEPHRDNILDLSHKFLSDNERFKFDCADAVTITKIWSAKEALYKLAGRKKIIFASELILDLDDNGNWIGTIDNFDHKLRVKLDIFDENQTIVSINSHAVERL
jgi:phosphopantetheinyl transferase